jgi:hypothetical protein
VAKKSPLCDDTGQVVDESRIVRTLITGHKGSYDDTDQVADKNGVVMMLQEGANSGL